MMCVYCHRRGRVTASGGEVRRLSLAGGVEVKMFVQVSLYFKWRCNKIGKCFRFRSKLAFILQIGPLRCWPGGLCLSRSIGDIDVGEFIVPIPHVKQVKVRSCSHGNVIL